MITSARTSQFSWVDFRSDPVRARTAWSRSVRTRFFHAPAALVIALLALLLSAPAPDALAQPEPSSRKPKPTTPAKSSAPKKDDASKTLAEEGRELFPEAADAAGAGGATGGGIAREPDWRILLATVTGPDAGALAQQALWKIQNVSQLPEAYLIERRPAHASDTKKPATDSGSRRTPSKAGTKTPTQTPAETPTETWFICYGRYPSPTDPRAVEDLDRIRQLRVASERPFAGAVLLPPDDDERAITSAYDLRTVRTAYATDEPLYTLAIGFYTRADLGKPTPEELKEYRTLAEEATAKLRREGDQAYFYHGPNGSQVTIGVFTPEDYDPIARPGIESFLLTEARKKYPNYLLNGMGQVRTIVNSVGWRKELVPSTLVEIPR